jgi:type II secretion system protein C
MLAPRLSLCLPLALLACGHAPPTEAVTAATAPASAPPAAAPKPSDTAAATISRSAIQRALLAGPGAFLQKVTVDDHPVMSGGKFHGFRIAALSADSFAGVDLKPGDVVVRVEGMPIEHPEEAIEAFQALAVASELSVDYERDGQPRRLRYRIVDDESPSPAAKTVPGK